MSCVCSLFHEQIGDFPLSPLKEPKRMIRTRCFTRLIGGIYNGTPGSLAYSDFGREALSRDIETVKLAFDKHASPNPTPGLPPMVFLHGLFGSKSNNRSVSRQLAKRSGRDVYCLDLRNHGDSPHNDRHDYPSMAADVERFIEEHNLNQPVVIGHSMGAKAAMALMLRNGNLCSKLVSVDNAPIDFTGGVTGFSKFGRYVRQMQVMEAKQLHSLKECDAILATVEPSLPIRQFLLTNMRVTESGWYKSRVPLGVMAKQLDNVSGWPFNPEISRWGGDALFIRGLQSSYVVDSVIGAIGVYFPRFSLESIDCGHWVTSEAPDAFISSVLRFVEEGE